MAAIAIHGSYGPLLPSHLGGKGLPHSAAYPVALQQENPALPTCSHAVQEMQQLREVGHHHPGPDMQERAWSMQTPDRFTLENKKAP